MAELGTLVRTDQWSPSLGCLASRHRCLETQGIRVEWRSPILTSMCIVHQYWQDLEKAPTPCWKPATCIFTIWNSILNGLWAWYLHARCLSKYWCSRQETGVAVSRIRAGDGRKLATPGNEKRSEKMMDWRWRWHGDDTCCVTRHTSQSMSHWHTTNTRNTLV